MTTVDLQQIRDELTHSLRNGNVLTTTVRGVTTLTENFTATTGQTIFNLAHTGVKNIRSLTVQSIAKYFLRDYTVSWATGVITLNTGASLGDAVAIQYDYSSNADKIYMDMPRDELFLTSYPRVGMDIVSSSTENFGLGGTTHISDVLVSIYAWIPANKDSNVAGGLGGTRDIMSIMELVRDVIRTNAKSYYSFKYIYPTATGPLRAGTNNKIIQINQDFKVKFLVE